MLILKGKKQSMNFVQNVATLSRQDFIVFAEIFGKMMMLDIGMYLNFTENVFGPFSFFVC